MTKNEIEEHVLIAKLSCQPFYFMIKYMEGELPVTYRLQDGEVMFRRTPLSQWKISTGVYFENFAQILCSPNSVKFGWWSGIEWVKILGDTLDEFDLTSN